jgi:hypothetical protein
MGDVNNDGTISVADVMALVNIVLGENTANYNMKAADMNKDESISIADAMAIVNIILGQTE